MKYDEKNERERRKKKLWQSGRTNNTTTINCSSRDVSRGYDGHNHCREDREGASMVNSMLADITVSIFNSGNEW